MSNDDNQHHVDVEQPAPVTLRPTQVLAMVNQQSAEFEPAGVSAPIVRRGGRREATADAAADTGSSPEHQDEPLVETQPVTLRPTQVLAFVGTDHQDDDITDHHQEENDETTTDDLDTTEPDGGQDEEQPTISFVANYNHPIVKQEYQSQNQSQARLNKNNDNKNNVANANSKQNPNIPTTTPNTSTTATATATTSSTTEINPIDESESTTTTQPGAVRVFGPNSTENNRINSARNDSLSAMERQVTSKASRSSVRTTDAVVTTTMLTTDNDDDASADEATDNSQRDVEQAEAPVSSARSIATATQAEREAVIMMNNLQDGTSATAPDSDQNGSSGSSHGEEEKQQEESETVIQATKVDEDALEAQIMSKLVNNAIQAEVLGETMPDAEEPGATRKKYCILALVLVLIMGAIAGLVGGLVARNNNKSDSNNKDTKESGSATNNTPAPTTASPTTTPSSTPSEQPSAAPSFSPENQLIWQTLRDATADLYSEQEHPLDDPSSIPYQAFLWLIGPNGNAMDNPTNRLLNRFAMACLYYATNGDEWTNNDLWLTSEDECLWWTNPINIAVNNEVAESFTSPDSDICDRPLRVRRFNLAANNLQGFLPRETIGLLNNLIDLRLNSNTLTGQLPIDEMLGLNSAVILDLSENQFTGPLPLPLLPENSTTNPVDSSAYFPNLQELRLNGNRFQESDISQRNAAVLSNVKVLDISSNLELQGELTVNAGWDQLNAVQELYLNSMELSGTIHDDIWQAWSSLTILNLKNSGLGGTLPEFIGSFQNLESLDLSYSTRGGLKGGRNHFSGQVPVSFDQLQALTSLVISDNNFNGTLPNEFFQLTNLVFLEGHDNEFSSTLPTEIGNMTALAKFGFRGNQLTGPLPTELGLLSDAALREFRVHENEMTGPIPTQLGSLSNLFRLFINTNRLTGEIPTHIGGMTGLASFVIHNNDFISTIPTEIGQLQNVGYFTFMWLYGVYGPIPTEIGNLSQLTRFRMTEMSITGPLPSQIGNLVNVEQFKVQNTLLGGSLPSQLGNLNALTEFSLFNNSFTGEIPAALTNLTGIKTVSFALNEFNGTMPLCDAGSLSEPCIIGADCSEFESNCPCCTFCCQDGQECDAPEIAGRRSADYLPGASRPPIRGGPCGE